MADSSRMRRADRVVVESCWCFGRMDRKRLKEVVDSGFERCRMRLPLTRRSLTLKRKRLRRNEKFFKNSLTD